MKKKTFTYFFFFFFLLQITKAWKKKRNIESVNGDIKNSGEILLKFTWLEILGEILGWKYRIRSKFLFPSDPDGSSYDGRDPSSLP